MKKLLFLLIMVVSLFSFTNVSAEEIATKTLSPEVETKVFEYLEAFDFGDGYTYPNGLIMYATNEYIFALVYENINNSYLFYKSNNNYVVMRTISNNTRHFIRFDLEGNFSYKTSNVVNISDGSNITSISNLVYTTFDIYTDENKTDIYFAKNYPKQEEVEPTPTTSPEPTTSPIPTDTPEIDTSELEKCDSFVCDISDSILSGFDDERFPFVKIIANFLLLLLMIFLFISPLWLLYKLWRWIF